MPREGCGRGEGRRAGKDAGGPGGGACDYWEGRDL